MKKSIVMMLILSVIMFVNINAVEIAYLQTPDGLVYSINEADEVIIEGTAGYVNKVVIPDEIEGKPVRYIAEVAFYNNPNITSVTISDNVVSIGKEAFGNCQELRKVVLPVGLETIEIGTFIKCGMLTDIELPLTLKLIDDFAFDGCNRLKNLTIPASVEHIGHETFIGCENLLMDVSLNEYAADYAQKNSIETDYETSWDYVFRNCVLLTAGVGIVCIAVYVIVRAAKNKKQK
jgi:hypothetical protein